MKIISFAWTTRALLEGRKTVTRRHWTKQLVQEGDLVQAYDRSPRFKGKPVAIIKIEKVSQEKLSDITSAEMEKEGFSAPCAGRLASCKCQSREDFIAGWIENYGGDENQLVWRIQFRVIDILDKKPSVPYGTSLPGLGRAA